MKMKREDDKIVGFLRLLNGSRVDLSFDKNSKIVLLDFENQISRMGFQEFKDFVKALEKYIKYIENTEKENLTI